jgi:hypothetical protein
VPIWLDVLQGNLTPQHFLETISIQIDNDVFVKIDTLAAPQGYLMDIGWKEGCSSFSASGMRASLMHRNYISGDHGFCAGQYFHAAVKQYASGVLSGDDPYERSPYDGFYSHLNDCAYVQVAGTKNIFHFIEGMFDIEWDQSLYLYKHKAKAIVDDAVTSSLLSLVLGQRSIPGMNILPTEPAWPGYDDSILQGYLNPDETEVLARHMEYLMAFEASQNDDVFPIFKDRVTRAADEGFGLVTLKGGLLL